MAKIWLESLLTYYYYHNKSLNNVSRILSHIPRQITLGHLFSTDKFGRFGELVMHQDYRKRQIQKVEMWHARIKEGS